MPKFDRFDSHYGKKCGMSTLKGLSSSSHYLHYLVAYFFILLKLQPDLAQFCFSFMELFLQCFPLTSLPEKKELALLNMFDWISRNYHDALLLMLVPDVYLLQVLSFSLLSPLSVSAVFFRTFTCIFNLSASVLYFPASVHRSNSHPEDHCSRPSSHLFSRE